jgi:L,D-peptidoglycan transpeptidase YkuD (ErfK/YbiS/YcfS/YnhG family)
MFCLLFTGFGSVACAQVASENSPSDAADVAAAPVSASSPMTAAQPALKTLPRPSATKPVPQSSKPLPSTTSPLNLASRLKTLPAKTSQVVIVHASSSSTTYATLETFTKVGGVWRAQFGKMTARVGKDGIGSQAREGVPMTPEGVYGFGATMYGVKTDPGVHYTWHHLVANDWWDESPSSPTYNMFVHGSDPGGASEALWKTVPAYNYFAVIKFNMPDPVSGGGSGIFLHVATSGPTAGCVSLPTADLLKVLTWLNPAMNPRIAIALDGDLKNY